MEDQVSTLKRIGIKAEAIHSGHTYGNIDRILDNCIYGDIKLLYVSPERLQHRLFKDRVANMDINIVAIDEAHCISQWGHDFRPSYLDIRSFIEEVRPKKLIALTATATSKVLSELVKSLFSKKPEVIRGSFVRDNIAIRVKQTEDKIGSIIRLCDARTKTIIYVRSRRKVKMLAETLSNHGVKAAFYHAGLSFKEKQNIQKRFKENGLQAVVATNAFGMGVDISNIRRVVHYDIPPSVEEYYQEIGRAGRDGMSSEAFFLISKDDIRFSKSRLTEAFPPFEYLSKLYKAVHVYYNIGIGEGELNAKSINYSKLAEHIGVSNKKVLAGIRAWQKLGVWEVLEDSKERLYCTIALTPKELRQEEYRIPDLYYLLDYFMRNYEQLFSGWIQIDLNRDASNLKISPKKLRSDLEILSASKVIRLFKLDAGPRITFLKNRISSKYVSNFEKKYSFLKEMAQSRNVGIHGLLNTRSCRMRYILEYFDEETTTDCGKCDNCLNIKNAESNSDSINRQRRLNEESEGAYKNK